MTYVLKTFIDDMTQQQHVIDTRTEKSYEEDVLGSVILTTFNETLFQQGVDAVFARINHYNSTASTISTGSSTSTISNSGGDVVLQDNLNQVVVSVTNRTVSSTSSGVFESKLIIPLYVVIFVLSVIGNSLVLVTLAQNKRMRTVTNVYLLNLAVSDLLLGVFCMPFTLVGQVLRNFIFGAAMCKLIPYFQAVSVSVGVWTLVAISLERYFAICRPLKSRRWQTQFHAYKMITVVWLASLLWNMPILGVSTLKAMQRGRGHKCREEWPSPAGEQAYQLFLDAMLLLVPLVIMTLAYSLIMTKLWKGLKREIKHNSNCQRQMQRSVSTTTMNGVINNNSQSDSASLNTLMVPSQGQGRRLHIPTSLAVNKPASLQLPATIARKCKVEQKKNKSGRSAEAVKLWLIKGMVQVRLPSAKCARTRFEDSGKTKTTLVGSRYELAEAQSPISNDNYIDDSSSGETGSYTFTRHAIRSNYMDKSIEAKRKVIRMLFVVVAEFFVCWAPLHVLNTWYLFAPDLVYQYVGSTGISLVQLLAYISSCCNPITYCFMNRKFRSAFLGVFGCYSMCCCCESLSGRQAAMQRAGVHLSHVQNNSDISGNDSTMYIGRASNLGKSEVVVLEAEDHV